MKLRKSLFILILLMVLFIILARYDVINVDFLGNLSTTEMVNSTSDDSGKTTTTTSENDNAYYIISFDTNGGTDIEELSIEHGSVVSLPTPEKEYYTFEGWYTDSDLTNLFTDTTMPDNNLYLYAGWSFSMTEGLLFSTNSDGYSISGYSGSSELVAIPSYYEGEPVTEISMFAFFNDSTVKEVIFEENSNIKLIKYGAFENSSITTIKIPKSVEIIDQNAFQNARKLETIEFEEGIKLEEIEYKTFIGTTSLKSITIPKSIVTIGYSAFKDAVSLESIAFEEDSQLITIKEEAFYNTKNLVHLELPEGLTVIEDYTFYNTKRLQNLVIPNSVSSIGDYAFYNPLSLVSLSIPSGVTYIGEGAFFNIKNLTSLQFETGSQLTYIDEEAFYGMEKLETLDLPDSLETIGDLAFYNAKSLTNITLPSSIINLGWLYLGGAINLQNIYVEEDNEDYYSIDGVLYNNNTLVQYPRGRSETTYVIPSNVKVLGTAAFEGAKLDSILIPASVIRLESSVFIQSSLFSIIFEEGSQLKRLEWNVFEGSNLTELTIPANVETIIWTSFDGANHLENIYVDSNNPFFSSLDGVLYNDDFTRLLKIPEGRTTTYFMPSTVQSIQNHAIYYAEIPSITVDSNNNTFSSLDGILFSKDQTVLIRYPSGKTDTNYTIPDFVTEVSGYAFINTKLKIINVPSNVTTLEYNSGFRDVFVDTPNLEAIHVDSENTVYSSIDGVLFDKAQTYLLKYPENKKDIDFMLPATLNAYQSFELNNIYVKNIIIPSDYIGDPEDIYNEPDIDRFFLLDSITILMDELPKTDLSFEDIKLKDDFKIYVPSELLNEYITDLYWQDFAYHIHPIESE